jgi:hypothetical protein
MCVGDVGVRPKRGLGIGLQGQGKKDGKTLGTSSWI